MEFTLSIAADSRYKDLDIVHMGDSAGGWMALRMRQLMCGLILGEEKISGLDLDEHEFETIRGLVGKGSTIMISPVVNLEITEPLRQLDSVVSFTYSVRILADITGSMARSGALEDHANALGQGTFCCSYYQLRPP